MNDDLGPNKAHLFCTAATAKPGDVLVDLGVRDGCSSLTMLEATAGQQCRVFGVDPSPKPDIDDPRYTFLQTDSVSAAQQMIGQIFLVFFDTLHIKEQVMAELHWYWPMIQVGGWAIFHDTEWPPNKFDHYLGRDWEQAVEGVNAFFGTDNPHVTRVHYPESHGMTFVKKLDDWQPALSTEMIGALGASEELTKHVCGI